MFVMLMVYSSYAYSEFLLQTIIGLTILWILIDYDFIVDYKFNFFVFANHNWHFVDIN